MLAKDIHLININWLLCYKGQIHNKTDDLVSFKILKKSAAQFHFTALTM